MTDDELDHAESIFRNPPSASLPAELGLRLIAEIRLLKPLAVVGSLHLPPASDAGEVEPIMKVVDEQHFGGAKPAPKKKGGK